MPLVSPSGAVSDNSSDGPLKAVAGRKGGLYVREET